jgi:hypothetical protein
MTTGYLNQTAIWHYVTGQNEYGEPAFGSKSIKVRWEDVQEFFMGDDGQETVSNAKVLCAENVQKGDLLEYSGRSWPVRKVSAIPWLDGSVTHREVLL